MVHDWAITQGLDGLKFLRFADNPNRGYWNFLSIDEMIARLSTMRAACPTKRNCSQSRNTSEIIRPIKSALTVIGLVLLYKEE